MGRTGERLRAAAMSACEPLEMRPLMTTEGSTINAADPTFNSLGYNATQSVSPGHGGVDKFRIRIWDPSGGIIYDNQMGATDDADPTTIVTRGNIDIHA